MLYPAEIDEFKLEGSATGSQAMHNTQLSELILKLTDSAIVSSSIDHQSKMVSLIREVVQFDAAWWGWSSFTGGRTRLVNSASYNLPRSFDAAVRAVSHIDPFIRRGRNLPLFSMQMSPSTASVAPEYKAFAKSYNVGAILNGHCRLESASSFHFFMSLYRTAESSIFNTDEVDDFRIILRHLEQSLSVSVRREIKATAPVGGEAAILDADGQIVHATSGFAKALATEKMGKRQRNTILGRLPEKTTHWIGQSVTLTTERYTQDLALVSLSQPGAWDVLAPREKKVAELYLAGMSMRAIAVANRVSPNTVRNQLASIYKKTSTKGKLALSQALMRN